SIDLGVNATDLRANSIELGVKAVDPALEAVNSVVETDDARIDVSQALADAGELLAVIVQSGPVLHQHQGVPFQYRRVLVLFRLHCGDKIVELLDVVAVLTDFPFEVLIQERHPSPWSVRGLTLISREHASLASGADHFWHRAAPWR